MHSLGKRFLAKAPPRAQPLISTGLQPGVMGCIKGSRFNGFWRCLPVSLWNKPLKRFAPPALGHTRLKPGANESGEFARCDVPTDSFIRGLGLGLLLGLLLALPCLSRAATPDPVFDLEKLLATPLKPRTTKTTDRKSTRLNSSHVSESRMPSSA